LNFDLKNNGNTLTCIFYETDHGNVSDRFVISKDNSKKKTYSDDEGEMFNEFDCYNKYYFASTK
jgi:hypothetical protein